MKSFRQYIAEAALKPFGKNDHATYSGAKHFHDQSAPMIGHGSYGEHHHTVIAGGHASGGHSVYVERHHKNPKHPSHGTPQFSERVFGKHDAHLAVAHAQHLLKFPHKIHQMIDSGPVHESVQMDVAEASSFSVSPHMKKMYAAAAQGKKRLAAAQKSGNLTYSTKNHSSGSFERTGSQGK